MPNDEQKNMFEGATVIVRGKGYIIPALSFAQIESLAPAIDRLDEADKNNLTPAIMKDATSIIQAALSRNYPEVTVDDVKEMIDLRNFQQIIDAVMGGAGLVKVPADAGAGETKPVA